MQPKFLFYSHPVTGWLKIGFRDYAISSIGFHSAEAKLTVPADLKHAFDRYFNYLEPISLPISLIGAPFSMRVWQALKQIPSGTTKTYGQIAHELGSCAQAVGQACKRNPLPIIVPCHRVVAAKGTGGYAGQTQGRLMQIKHNLLAIENKSQFKNMEQGCETFYPSFS